MHRSISRAVAVALGLAALALAPAAAAAPTEVARSPVMQGPILAGDDVVWLNPHGGGGHDPEIVAVRPGAEARVLRREPYTTRGVRFAVSGAALAFEQSAFRSLRHDPQATPYALFAGPLEGPHEEVCSAPHTTPPAPAVDGTRVLYETCAAGTILLRLRDVADGSDGAVVERPSGPGRATTRIDLEGRYLGWSSWREITVQEVDTGRVAMRVEAPRDLPGHRAWDLQADGKVAVAYELGDRRGQLLDAVRLAWLSPQEPYLHELGVEQSQDGVGALRLVLAGDRILYVRPVSPCSAAAGFELALADLSGTVRRVAGPISWRAAEPFAERALHDFEDRGVTGFDFDGRRAVWAGDAPLGGGTREPERSIVLQDLEAEPPPLDSGREPCPPRAAPRLLASRRPARLTRAGEVPVALACQPAPGTRPYDCNAVVRLRTAGRIRIAGRRRRIDLGRAEMHSLEPGRACARFFRTSRTVRAALRGARRVRMEVVVRRYLDAHHFVPAGGRVVRRFTLSTRPGARRRLAECQPNRAQPGR